MSKQSDCTASSPTIINQWLYSIFPSIIDAISEYKAGPVNIEQGAEAPLVEEKFKFMKQLATRLAPAESEEQGRALAQKHSTLNRYTDRIGFGHSRVILDESVIGHSYINASFLQPSPLCSSEVYQQFRTEKVGDTEKETASFSKPKYIASQAPLPRTFSHFWFMVWQYDVSLLVTLVDVEFRRCEQFWPDSSRPILPFDNLGLKVRLISEQNIFKHDIVERVFILSYGTSEKLVRQVHYRTWPDHDVPPSMQVMDVLLKATRSHGSASFGGILCKNWTLVSDAPVLVHCSAGIGRTGTFCVIDSLIDDIADCSSNTNNQESASWEVLASDLPLMDPVIERIIQFRHQRKGMVQTRSQLAYIYRFLAHYYSVS